MWHFCLSSPWFYCLSSQQLRVKRSRYARPRGLRPRAGASRPLRALRARNALKTGGVPPSRWWRYVYTACSPIYELVILDGEVEPPGECLEREEIRYRQEPLETAACTAQTDL